VEGVADEGAVGLEGFHLLVWDLDAGGVGGLVEFGVDAQAGAGGGGPDGLDDYLVAGQGSSAPVCRDVGEEPVFDLVPCGGAGG
jgi:hypothetical protein